MREGFMPRLGGRRLVGRGSAVRTPTSVGFGHPARRCPARGARTPITSRVHGDSLTATSPGRSMRPGER